MDLFTQNMINRTKQRQELLSKLKPNSSVVSSSTASESNQMVVVKETTGNGNRKEKENNCLSTSNKTTASIKPTTTQPTISKATAIDQVEDALPAAQSGSRRTRLDALAYRINDWEDESLSNLKQTALPVREKNFETPTKDYIEKGITKVTPGKVSDGISSSVKELNSPTARKHVSGHLSTKPSATTSTAISHVNATASPTKAVVLDKSVLHCLESQGFKPTTSRSRLIYEYEKEQEAEVEDEAAKSWTYSAGTPEKRASGRPDNRSPAAVKESPKSRAIRSPIYITKTDQAKKSPLILNQKPNANQKIGNSSKDTKSATNLAPPMKRSGNSGAAQSSSKKEIINSHDVGVSVLKRVAQFDSPRLPARDPAEFSLSERKALFEKNKGKPPTPKFASPDVSRPSVKNAASPISTAFNADQNYGLPKSSMEHSLSAYKNASNAKAERMKELEELRNRHGEKRHLEPTALSAKTPSKEIAFNIIEENEINESSDLPIVKSLSPVKSSISMPKFENPKGFRKSPAKDSYAGLDEVKPIRVSPPKPGKLYPCLSDIEMTTENETDSDDSEDFASPSDSSPVATMNTSQDLDSSFTTDILGRAGLSQFINTPKKKLQEMQLNKQALLRSIAEHNLIVSDDDSEEIGEISDLLNEALEQHNSSGGSTPPKQLKLDRKSQSVDEDGPSTMLYHSVSSYRKQQQDQTATPVRQVVRNPEVRSTHTTTSKSNESQDIPIQQQIRNLQEEINTQQTVMAQASQALNLCRATAEFSGSTEQVEGEKLLLVASQKRQAAMNEIQRLKTEAAMKKSSGGYASRGTLSISGLSLPLKRDFVAMHSKGGDDYIHYFIMLIRHRGQVIPLQMLSTLDGIQDGALRFPNLIQLRDLPADFQVAIEVYALQTKKEKLDHNQKYHIRKDSSKMRLTPKKLVNKQESRLLSKTPLSSPAGPSAVRSSSFGLVGFTTISSTSLRRQEWSLEKVPFASPIDGALQLKIQCHTESLIEERGFLTIFEDVGGFGAWHRRWCLLSNDQLLFWKYPDDEKRKEPLSYINLRKCVTEVVDAVSHDICARPNTFLLVTVREPLPGDKDSLVMTCYPHRTALRHLISADLKDERQLWCSQLNRAIGNLRAWDIDSQQPSAEGSTPKIIG